MMQESGVDLDFDQLLDGEEAMGLHGPFYELQSKPIIGSPQTEVKHAPSTNRTNLKLALMKQQAEEEAKRNQHQYNDGSTAGFSIPASGMSSNSMCVPSSGPTTEVPPQVLQVKSRLANPTKYYVRQSQKRQIEQYLVGEMGKGPITQSLPPIMTTNSVPTTAGTSAPTVTMGNSAPTDPDSPLSMGMSSTATSVSEVDELLGGFLDLETVDHSIDSDLSFIEPTLTHMSQTLPPQNNNQTFMGQLYEQEQQSPTELNKSSSSCPGAVNRGGRQRQEAPPFMTDDEARVWAKERQKKDNHNMIERRRRFNINDRIKELGTLLPKGSDPSRNAWQGDLRQNKGTILKASVDYIRRLKKDHERLRTMEDRQRQLESTNRKMLLRIQEMEMSMKTHGISMPGSNSAELLSDLLKQQQQAMDMIKQEPQVDELMEDCSPVSGDPMMSASSPVVVDSRRSSASMEESSDLTLLN
jgi:hypothetical protein